MTARSNGLETQGDAENTTATAGSGAFTGENRAVFRTVQSAVQKITGWGFCPRIALQVGAWLSGEPLQVGFQEGRALCRYRTVNYSKL